MREITNRIAALVIALAPPVGHAAWALARSADDEHSAAPTAVAVAAVSLELSIFFAVVGTVFAATRVAGTHVPLLALLRPLAFAQAPAVLYFLGLVPALTHFMPLLALVVVA